MTGGSLTILVVEDDLFTRTLVAGALRGAGHTVVDVESVRQAMKESAENDFHLIVSDLNLGNGPSGADLLTRIHEDQPWVGKIALTSHASPELAIGPLATLPRGTVYLVKSELREIGTLFAAMQRALSGEQQPRVDVAEDGRAVVTRSQAEVLRMLSAGYATSVIAEQRNTTVRAAEMMIQRLYDKLGLKESNGLDPRTGAVLLWQQGRVRVS